MNHVEIMGLFDICGAGISCAELDQMIIIMQTEQNWQVHKDEWYAE